jgi:hypothetical protein
MLIILLTESLKTVFSSLQVEKMMSLNFKSKKKKKVRDDKTHDRDAQEIVKRLVIELKALKNILKALRQLRNDPKVKEVLKQLKVEVKNAIEEIGSRVSTSSEEIMNREQKIREKVSQEGLEGLAELVENVAELLKKIKHTDRANIFEYLASQLRQNIGIGATKVYVESGAVDTKKKNRSTKTATREVPVNNITPVKLLEEERRKDTSTPQGSQAMEKSSPESLKQSTGSGAGDQHKCKLTVKVVRVSDKGEEVVQGVVIEINGEALETDQQGKIEKMVECGRQVTVEVKETKVGNKVYVFKHWGDQHNDKKNVVTVKRDVELKAYVSAVDTTD